MQIVTLSSHGGAYECDAVWSGTNLQCSSSLKMEAAPTPGSQKISTGLHGVTFKNAVSESYVESFITHSNSTEL